MCSVPNATSVHLRKNNKEPFFLASLEKVGEGVKRSLADGVDAVVARPEAEGGQVRLVKGQPPRLQRQRIHRLLDAVQAGLLHKQNARNILITQRQLAVPVHAKTNGTPFFFFYDSG